MDYTVNTDYGRINIKDVVIDLEGREIKGVDISRAGEFLLHKPHYEAFTLRKNIGQLHKWLHQHTYKN